MFSNFKLAWNTIKLMPLQVQMGSLQFFIIICVSWSIKLINLINKLAYSIVTPTFQSKNVVGYFWFCQQQEGDVCSMILNNKNFYFKWKMFFLDSLSLFQFHFNLIWLKYISYDHFIIINEFHSNEITFILKAIYFQMYICNAMKYPMKL